MAERGQRIVDALERRGQFRIKPGLGRVRKVLSLLGNPQDPIRAIHIAGTNGKGSVSASLESILRHSGYHTGLYTSPHLCELRERIQIDRHALTPSEFNATAERVHEAEEQAGLQLTYFEFVTVMAFLKFAEEPVDIAIIETGLGGRWDATNVLKKPELSVITSIGRDHMQWLGSTEKEIAREKAGIIKTGRPVVSGVQGEGRSVIAQVARQRRSPLFERGTQFEARLKKTDWAAGTQTVIYHHRSSGRRFYKVHLLGTHQIENAAVTLAAIQVLRRKGWSIREPALQRGLENVQWPGRFQLFEIADQAPVLFDGAHNVPGLDRLLETLRTSPWADKPKTFVFSVYKDKEYALMIKRIAAQADQVMVCALPGSRALPVRQAVSAFEHGMKPDRVHRASTPTQALSIALERTPPDGLVVVTGSLTLIGLLLEKLAGKTATGVETFEETSPTSVPGEHHV